MKKRLRVVAGKSLGITFTKEEREIRNMEEGDIIDLSDIMIIKKEEEEKND
ncbi:MAG: hypothetical protein ACTSUG_00245 [Candidatus Helarchaeota archaeon]